MEYDSTAETLLHIKRVNELLIQFSKELLDRATRHDDSKLGPFEKPFFDKETPLLKDLEYDTPEYKASTERLGDALMHHYENNSHHPQHYENGVNDMDLLDVVEMLLDWKASTERTVGGDIRKSIRINKQRFGISKQLGKILMNTVDRMEI